MKEFLLYMFQSAICLSLFGGIYMLFLRKQTCFNFNRFFLLVGLISSFILPSIKISYNVIIPSVEANLGSLNPQNKAMGQEGTANIWVIMAAIYTLGIVVIMIRNFRILSKLNRLRESGKKSFIAGYRLIENAAIKTPFSAFNQVFMNTDGMQSKEKEIILKHEISHIYQKHWIDLLCSECALLLQWFNPLMWYYVHLQKENHEYLADQAVLSDGESIAVYRAVLINQRFQGPIFSFANSFNYSNQQNRLNMMKKTKTSPWKKIASLAVIPLFGAFLGLSAKPNYVIQESQNATPKDSTITIKVTSKEDIEVISKQGKRNKDNTIVVTNKPIEGAKKASRMDLDNLLLIVDGKEVKSKVFEKLDPNTIESMSVLKDGSGVKIYGTKAEDGVIVIVTKTDKSK